MNLVLYLIAINLLTYALYWLDKRAAVRGGWRIPEATLLLAGFAGGTLAAIVAQQRLRHKTKKLKFRLQFWGLTLVQIALLLFQPAMLKQLIARFNA